LVGLPAIGSLGVLAVAATGSLGRQRVRDRLVQLHRLPLHPCFRPNLLTQGRPSGRQPTLRAPALAVSDNDGCPLIAAVAPHRRSAAFGNPRRRRSRELGERMREAEIVVLSSFVPSAH